jgi:hypothetical protein
MANHQMLHQTLRAALLGALIAGAPAALAQATDYGTQADTGAAPVDDQTVSSFAGAMSEVRDIQTSFSAKLENVKDEDKARELQMQAQGKMVEAVEGNGLSVQEYNSLSSQMKQDPVFRSAVMAQLEGQ